MSDTIVQTEPGRDNLPVGGPASVRFTAQKPGAPLERTARIAFWIYWVAWIGTLGYAWTRDPGLTHGDTFSDANVLNASRNFDQFGLGLYYGLPVHFATYSAEHPVPPYTHYPPGPEWIHETLKAAGMRELWQFRAASVAVAGIALLLAKAAFTRLSGSHLLGTLGVFFYSWSAPFSQFADSLHEHTYLQLTLFAFIASWLAFERAASPGWRRLWFAVAILSFFVDMWLSFEHILLVPIFAGLRMLCVGRRRDFAGAATIVLLPLLVMALRLGHNSLALGGLRAGFNDLATIAQFRAAVDEPATLARSVQTWRVRLGRGGALTDESDRDFIYPLLRPAIRNTAPLLAVILLCVWPLSGVAPVRRGCANALLMLVAAVPWFLVMKNHALIHRHLVMLLLPGLALLLASLVTGGLLQWWYMPRRAPLRWIGPVIALVLLGGFAAEMRKSLALNHLVPLDARVTAEIPRRRDAMQIVHMAGAGPLRDAQRVLFAGNLYPEIACELGRPYEFVLTKGPIELTPGQAMWIECWSDIEKAHARRAVERYGFPDMLSTAHSPSMIFRPGRPPGEATDIRYEGDYCLTQLRCVPTLDGRSWLVQSRFALPPTASRPAEDLIQFMHVLGDHDELLVNADVRFSWGLQDANSLILWRTIPRSSIPAHARLRIGLWSTSQGRALTPALETATLPPSATPDREHGAFVWDAFSTPAEETP